MLQIEHASFWRAGSFLTFCRVRPIFNAPQGKELRKIFIIGAFLVAAYACCSALEFRNTSWLMTKDQVVAAEGGHADSERTISDQQEEVFRSYVSGFPVTITYILENNMLLSASYTFKRDPARAAFNAMKSELVSKDGAPTFERNNIIGWRLEKTEIALTHLPDGTTYVAYWEKAYFARINHLGTSGGPGK
jgi:hypothetical protein